MNIPLSFTLAHIQGRYLMCFLIWQKLLHWIFGGHCLREGFQTLSDYNLAQGLAIHNQFDDLDLISRSEVCQNQKLPIVFRFLSSVVYWYVVSTHIKKIRHSLLCVTGVHLWDITKTIFVILHLNVSHLSVFVLEYVIQYTLIFFISQGKWTLPSSRKP